MWQERGYVVAIAPRKSFVLVGKMAFYWLNGLIFMGLGEKWGRGGGAPACLAVSAEG